LVTSLEKGGEEKKEKLIITENKELRPKTHTVPGVQKEGQGTPQFLGKSQIEFSKRLDGKIKGVQKEGGKESASSSIE